MLQFKSLKNCSIDDLLDVFNASFADYLVPLQLSREQLERKLTGDSVDLELSVGAFDGGTLAGFILHGINTFNDTLAVYNAGTGVRPAYRGQRATAAMYRFILPRLKEQDISKAVLEVIDKNIPAIQSYKGVGYSIHRELLCFRGVPQWKEKENDADIKIIEEPDWDDLQRFWDWVPSWQNSVTALRNIGAAQPTIGICDKGRVVAYANYNPQNNRIAQFAVDKAYRGKGLASQLFRHICPGTADSCTLINVPADATGTLAFLHAGGLTPFISQYEMVMDL